MISANQLIISSISKLQHLPHTVDADGAEICAETSLL